MRRSTRRLIVGALIAAAAIALVALRSGDPRGERGAAGDPRQVGPEASRAVSPTRSPLASAPARNTSVAPSDAHDDEDPLASLPPDLAVRFAEADAASDAHRHERAAELYLEVLRAVDDPSALHPELWLRAVHHALSWRSSESVRRVTPGDGPAGYAAALQDVAFSALPRDHPGAAPVGLMAAAFSVDRGELERAEALALEALDARFRDGGQMLRLTRGGLFRVGLGLVDLVPGERSRPEVAVRLLERALENHARLPPDPERDASVWARELERAHRAAGDEAAADRVMAEWDLETTYGRSLEEHFDERRLEREVARLDRERSPDDIALLETMDSLALVRAVEGRTEEALEIRREILERVESSDAGRDRLSEALADVARLEARRGRLAEAEHLYARAIAVAEEDPRAEEHALAQRLERARLLEEQGRERDAARDVSRLSDAVARRIEAWGPDSAPMAYVGEAGLALELAEIHELAGRTVEAETLLRALLDANPSGEMPALMGRLAEVALGDLLWEQGREAEARAAYRSAVEGGWIADAEASVAGMRSVGRGELAEQQAAEIDRVRARLAD